MCLIFFGITGCLFVIFLIAFFVLLKLQKLDKKKITIAVFGVLLPVFIATAVLAPFAYADFANGNYPKIEKFKLYEFYGTYDVAESTIPYPKKLFEWNIIKCLEPHDWDGDGMRFRVAKPEEFDAYLATVDSFVGTSTEIRDASYTVFTFSAEGKTWELLKYNNSPKYYKWRRYAVGSEVYKTWFTAIGPNRTTYDIFKYYANDVEEHGNGGMIHKRFEVDDPAAFEEYLATVETYSGIFEDETVKTISFEKDGNVWSLVNYKSSPDIYYWYYVASGTEA